MNLIIVIMKLRTIMVITVILMKVVKITTIVINK